jgi:hypothetical protein
MPVGFAFTTVLVQDHFILQTVIVADLSDDHGAAQTQDKCRAGHL